MKNSSYNPFDRLIIKVLFFFWAIVAIYFLGFNFVSANENSVKMAFSSGRAVIINGDKDAARKRALDEALYLASLQGGAKVDGFSSIDTKTRLKESLVIRPASEIIDFKVLDEGFDLTHYEVKIQAALLQKNIDLKCDSTRINNISFLQPHYVVSSNSPAWTHHLPSLISSIILKNLKNLKDLKMSDKRNFFIDPENKKRVKNELNYEALTEKTLYIKNGEYSIIPSIKISRALSRLHRFSDELVFSIDLLLYEGPNYSFVDSFSYDFSLNLGNHTGYEGLDSFYSVSKSKIIEYLDLSLSKYHFRIHDTMKCLPLETKLIYSNEKLIANLGTNQGLYRGKIGLISTRNPDNSMENWSVMSVVSSDLDASILEPLNPNIDLIDLNGKLIRFLN